MSYPHLPENPTDVVFDLDDAQCSSKDYALGFLFYLKGIYPKLKITLFAIPARCTPSFLKALDALDWVELAVHGYDHNSNYESLEWSLEQALESLEYAERLGHFVKGFKAPGWQISDATYQALLQKGYWVADQDYNNDRRPKELPCYLLSHPWCVHGHTWSINTPDPLQQNGIEQLLARGLEFTPETNFHFISEIINTEWKKQS